MREKVRFLADVAKRARPRDPHRRQLRLRRPRDEGPLPRGRRAGDGRVGARALPLLDELGFERYVVSLKDSDPRKVIEANRRFAEARPDVPLHLGVTEAGIPPEGVIKTRIAFEQLLSRGIGDTLRVSLTLPNPRKHEEIAVGLQILARRRRRPLPLGAGVRRRQLNIISCPSCSRVENERFVELAEKVQGDDGLRRAPRRHDRRDGLPRERPRRDRRRRPRPVVRPHPRQPQEEDRDAWAPTPTTRSCPRLKSELDALIEARTPAAAR